MPKRREEDARATGQVSLLVAVGSKARVRRIEGGCLVGAGSGLSACEDKEEWTEKASKRCKNFFSGRRRGAEKSLSSTLVGPMKVNAKLVTRRKVQKSTGFIIVQNGTRSDGRSQRLSESGSKKREPLRRSGIGDGSTGSSSGEEDKKSKSLEAEIKELYTHSVSHGHFSYTFSLRGVQTSRARMAQGVCSAHVTSLHLTFSLVMFHPPSVQSPHGHLDTSFLSAPSLPNCFRSESAGQAHFHSTSCEPKEFDKITSADGDTTPINDPNCDNISDFSKITRENTGLLAVSTMLEASVSHASHGESKDSMHQETVARQREIRKRRFCDHCCRVDVKEKSTEQYWESLSSDSQRIMF